MTVGSEANNENATPMTVTLDCRGLICPLPVLRARKALRALDPGATLMVIATDPAAPRDLLAFCRETGTRHLGQEERDGAFLIRLAR